MHGVHLLIAFIIVLFIFNILFIHPSQEGLENNGDSDIPTSFKSDTIAIVYQNQGIIKSIQQKVSDLAKQVNTLLMQQDTMSADIADLQKKEENNTKTASAADTLAQQNKARLLKMAQTAKAKGQQSKAQAAKLKPVG